MADSLKFWVTYVILVAAVLSGIELIRSHGESLVAWAALILAVVLLIEGNVL